MPPAHVLSSKEVASFTAVRSRNRNLVLPSPPGILFPTNNRRHKEIPNDTRNPRPYENRSDLRAGACVFTIGGCVCRGSTVRRKVEGRKPSQRIAGCHR